MSNFNRWQEVSNTLHGWKCSVMFDEAKAPGVILRFDGIIECPTAGAIPFLTNPSNNHVMKVPPWATVVVHTPTVYNMVW